jgi:hypothetical protein
MDAIQYMSAGVVRVKLKSAFKFFSRRDLPSISTALFRTSATGIASNRLVGFLTNTSRIGVCGKQSDTGRFSFGDALRRYCGTSTYSEQSSGTFCLQSCCF